MSQSPLAWCATHSEYVDDALDVARSWIRAAVSEREGAELGTTRPTIAAREEAIHQRALARQLVGDELSLLWLRERLGLTPTEVRVLWILLAHELDPCARTLLRQLNSENCADPTLDALRVAAYGSQRLPSVSIELGPHGRLRSLELIQRTDSDVHASEHRQTWKVSRRVLALAYGHVAVDDELGELVADRKDESTSPGIGGLGIEVDANAMDRISVAFDGIRRIGHGMLVLVGSKGTGRRSIFWNMCVDRRLSLIEVETSALPADPKAAGRLLRILSRECRLFDSIPLFRDLETLTCSNSADAADRIGILDREFAGLISLATSSVPIARRWEHAPHAIELPELTGVQRARLWARALPMATETDVDLLATMYPIAPALLDEAAKVARVCQGTQRMTPEHIRQGLRVVLDDRLAGLATRVKVTQTWNDLVLPVDQVNAIADLLTRVRMRRTVYEHWGFGPKVGRGLGVAALFSGVPGTGKTMAAGLVANSLGTELYQVDPSKLVSKWLGETEKNLSRLFDAAEESHAILLFDEADALFGKRTDVKSSNDRHANQETNYLLQRLERFSGVCILTTNHETAIDEAFRRRIAVHVSFPMPELEERAHLWKTLLPADAPVEEQLDFGALAGCYEMSGGFIRNAVLRAAFLAAGEDSRITGAILSRAAQLEYQAMGRIAAS